MVDLIGYLNTQVVKSVWTSTDGKMDYCISFDELEAETRYVGRGQ